MRWVYLFQLLFLDSRVVPNRRLKNRWLWSNFYIGVDASLAALANAIVNILDAAHRVEGGFLTNVAGAEFGKQMYYTALCILVAIGALFATMMLHQRFEQDKPGFRKGILLGVIGNIVGAAPLAMFIFMKLRRLV